MRVVIVGGGMAGLVLARGIRHPRVEVVLIERAPAGRRIPGPIMLPFQSYDALDDLGLLEGFRRDGVEVPPFRGGLPVAIGIGREDVLTALREGVEIRWDHELLDLVRDGDRVVGARVRGPDGEAEVPADLVVGADGSASPTRDLAGIPAATRLSDTAFISFRSPVPAAQPFEIVFLSDGRQLTLLGWPGGSAGGWQIDRPAGGADEALAPGLDAFRRAFVRLIPAAAEPLAAVDRLGYREVAEVACDIWWAPGVALVGEALHAMNPEAGIGSGLGMGDAQALAVAIVRNPGDPDAACRDYEHWRRPAVAPYLAVGSQGVRVVRGGDLRDEERWPPVS